MIGVRTWATRWRGPPCASELFVIAPSVLLAGSVASGSVGVAVTQSMGAAAAASTTAAFSEAVVKSAADRTTRSQDPTQEERKPSRTTLGGGGGGGTLKGQDIEIIAGEEEIDFTPPLTPRSHQCGSNVLLTTHALSSSGTDSPSLYNSLSSTFNFVSSYADLSNLVSVNKASSYGSPDASVQSLVARLTEGSGVLSGQVVAYGWDQAVKISGMTRAAPARLLPTLWHATEECARDAKFTGEDVIDCLHCWSILQQSWTRQFCFSSSTMSTLTQTIFPCVIKRMSWERLEMLVNAVRSIAQYRQDPALSVLGSSCGCSPRDLMQPIFALVVVEVLWRCMQNEEDCRSRNEKISGLIDVVLSTSKVWRWKVLLHRDDGPWVSVKVATRTALEHLQLIKNSN